MVKTFKAYVHLFKWGRYWRVTCKEKKICRDFISYNEAYEYAKATTETDISLRIYMISCIREFNKGGMLRQVIEKDFPTPEPEDIGVT